VLTQYPVRAINPGFFPPCTMNKLTISIAMCSYNGEKYIQEQLDSIANQSRLPDELIICDDKSTDKTLPIVEKFSDSSRFPVIVIKNGTNLGSTKNFEQAITLCNGDIISLSDQDDVWHKDKLKLIEEAFNSSMRTGAVFSNGNIVDEDLLPLGYTLWDKFSFGKKRRVEFAKGEAFQVLLKHNVATGATMAFRSNVREKILPISPLWIHDSWIAFLISIISDIKFIDQNLIDYRQHKDQQIGGIKNSIKEQIAISTSVKDYNFQIKQYEQIIEHISNNNFISGNHVVSKISDKITHLNNRQNIYRCHGIKKVIKSINELACGSYHRYSNGYKSFIKDVYMTDYQNLKRHMHSHD
jgi:glycosyltransferase involved in cell wall biosynthesis